MPEHPDPDDLVLQLAGMCSQCLVNVVLVTGAILAYRDENPTVTPTTELRWIADLVERHPPCDKWWPETHETVALAHHITGGGRRWELDAAHPDGLHD